MSDEACSDQPKDKHCVMGNACFGSVQGVVALAKAGCKAVLQIKTGSSVFPKAFIDDALKDVPGGVCIVLQATIKAIPLIAIGYHYITRTTQFFVATKDAGLTHPGSLYERKYTDDFRNVCLCKVGRPDIISKVFETNTINSSNLTWHLKNIG